ncbi:MAG: RNA polymerase sigma factor [Planctomycetaceae bacterium]
MSDIDSQSACEPDLPGLLANHRKWLRSVIVARLGSAAGAEDVLQEVHVAAIEQKSPLRDQSAVTAWLYQIALRQVMLFRRRLGRQRKREAGAAAIEETKHRESVDPLAWILRTERQTLVREALGLLGGKDRELLVLKYVEGWSYRQIAEHTRRSESAVESQLHRARTRLRAQLVRLDVVGGENND